jgi:hypothetical protein
VPDRGVLIGGRPVRSGREEGKAGSPVFAVTLAFCLGLVVLGGCINGAYVVASPDFATERVRSAILVIPGPRDPGTVPVARTAANLLTAELATRWFQVLDFQFVERASPDLMPHLTRIAHQVMTGQLVDRQVADLLFRRHGVGQLLVMDVFRYEQYWGRQTKITRVGVEARLVTVADGRILWQGRYDPELSGSPGHGLDAATRRVVRELVRAMTNGAPELKDTPAADWPVLEYFTPN